MCINVTVMIHILSKIKIWYNYTTIIIFPRLRQQHIHLKHNVFDSISKTEHVYIVEQIDVVRYIT